MNMQKPNLLDTTLTLLDACPLPRTQVARESGVSYRWLYKLKSGQAHAPSLPHVQRLHDYLKAISRQRKRA